MIDERTKKKMIRDLGKTQAMNSVEGALDGIMKVGQDQDDRDAPYDIRPKIDKVALYAARDIRYLYEDLERALDREPWIDQTLNKRYVHYKTNARLNAKGFRLIVSTYPVEPYFPSGLITIYPEDHVTPSQLKQILASLHNGLPYLNVSMVEYASDIFCVSPRAVQYLFLMVTRFVYCRHQRSVTLHEYECGAKDLSIGRRRERNCTFYAGGDKDRTIYERGPEIHRVGNAWPFHKLDRLRLEARVRKFVKKGSYTLGDFLSHAGFFRLNKDAWDFRCFKDSPRLPQPWETYGAQDEKGNALGSFHAEYLHYNKRIRNLSQYTKRVTWFDPLMERLFQVWKQFDDEWESSPPRRAAPTLRRRGDIT